MRIQECAYGGTAQRGRGQSGRFHRPGLPRISLRRGAYERRAGSGPPCTKVPWRYRDAARLSLSVRV